MSLRNVFAFFGLCESEREIERRSQLIEGLVNTSLSTVGARQIPGATMPYAARLRDVLDTGSTEDLETLHQHKVAVCFDRRINEMEEVWFGSTVLSLLHNKNGQIILSLDDTGKKPKSGGVIFLDTLTVASLSIPNLAEKLRKGEDIPPFLLGNPTVQAVPVYNQEFQWLTEDECKRELRKNAHLNLQEPPSYKERTNSFDNACRFNY